MDASTDALAAARAQLEAMTADDRAAHLARARAETAHERQIREYWTGPPTPTPISAAAPVAIALDHDYGDDATLLANFLTVPHPTLRQQAAITLLCMAVRAPRSVVVDEDAVDVCAAAIFDVTRMDGAVSAASCATLAHLACRAFARHQLAEPTGSVDVHALLAIGEACADVMCSR